MHILHNIYIYLYAGDKFVNSYWAQRPLNCWFLSPTCDLHIYKPFLGASWSGSARHEVLEMTHKFMPGSQPWQSMGVPQKFRYGTMVWQCLAWLTTGQNGARLKSALLMRTWYDLVGFRGPFAFHLDSRWFHPKWPVKPPTSHEHCGNIPVLEWIAVGLQSKFDGHESAWTLISPPSEPASIALKWDNPSAPRNNPFRVLVKRDEHLGCGKSMGYPGTRTPRKMILKKHGGFSIFLRGVSIWTMGTNALIKLINILWLYIYIHIGGWWVL